MFEDIKIEFERHWQRENYRSRTGVFTIPANLHTRLGQIVFSKIKEGGFCTFLVSGRQRWDPRDPYFEGTRQAAREGRKIERMFLLPHQYYRHNDVLREHIALDREAGITAGTRYVGDLLASSELPLPPDSLDFGFWDGTVVCWAVNRIGGSKIGGSEWRVSIRPEDQEWVGRIMAVLHERAKVLRQPSESSAEMGHLLQDGEDDQLDLEEPLVRTAPSAEVISDAVCEGSYIAPDDCAWYHSVWQYLRIFRMVSTPTWHYDFYREALTPLARSEQFQNVLISGTADYSMLAHVLWHHKQTQSSANVTVVDSCETPLILCRWYAREEKTPIKVKQTNILKYRPNTKFDLIVTDAFLTRFPARQRAEVAEIWQSLLRSGGKLITTARIESSDMSTVIRTSAEEVVRFRDTALKEARKWEDFLGKPAEDIATKAEEYAKRIVSYRIESVDEVISLLSDIGFKVEKCDPQTFRGEMHATTYAEIVARNENW